MREETIIRRLQSGDPAGLEALMERYIPYVSAVVWNILRDAMPPEDGEEVVSDVFLAAWRQAGDLRPGSVKAWLGSVARHKAKNRLRRMGRDLPLEEDALDIPGPEDPPGEYERAVERQLVRQACLIRTGRSFSGTTTTRRPYRRSPIAWTSTCPP